jgi:hypothetical protein
VPHEVPVPQEQDRRWKYGFAITAVLLLLLLLLLLFSFGAGSSGTDSGGSSQGAESTGATGETGPAASERIGGSPSVADSIESDGGANGESPQSEPPASATAEETGTGAVIESPIADAESEPPSDTAIEELIRRLNGDSEETDSQTGNDQKGNRTGGNAIVKGDATVNFFGATGKGSKFVFVFDRSSSMRGEPLAAVKRELIKSLEPLKSNHSFNIIAYDSQYDVWNKRLISATQENKANAIRFVESTDARGGTQPREPLLEAINQKPEVIFFMTDGQFTLNLDEITRSRKGNIPIHVVQFSGGSVPLPILQELAKRTGGEFMLIPVQGLSDAL